MCGFNSRLRHDTIPQRHSAGPRHRGLSHREPLVAGSNPAPPTTSGDSSVVEQRKISLTVTTLSADTT